MTGIHAPFSRLAPVTVFDTTATSVQLSARGLRGNDVEVQAKAGGYTSRSTHTVTNGAAVFTLTDLPPSTPILVTVGDLEAVQARTLDPPGPVLSRVATISDVHLGLPDFGLLHRIVEPDNLFDKPPAYRCARAAIDEAIHWGADLLIVKGDLTNEGLADEWRAAKSLLEDLPIPVVFAAGNHDVHSQREVELADIDLGDAVEVAAPTSPIHHRLGDTNVVVADTSIVERGHGTFAGRLEGIVDRCDRDRPTFLGIHHNIQRTTVPWFWPPGIPARTSARPLAAIREASASLFVTSGHTHRNRSHHLGDDITFTEVAATSDHPGVWAAYELTAEGIRQHVRRIETPEAVSWLERTAAGIAHVWPRWSPGRLDDRVVEHRFG